MQYDDRVVYSPPILEILLDGAARRGWYHQRHVERWERRYGKPYPELKMEVGSWGGVKFVQEDGAAISEPPQVRSRERIA